MSGVPKARATGPSLYFTQLWQCCVTLTPCHTWAAAVPETWDGQRNPLRVVPTAGPTNAKEFIWIWGGRSEKKKRSCFLGSLTRFLLLVSSKWTVLFYSFYNLQDCLRLTYLFTNCCHYSKTTPLERVSNTSLRISHPTLIPTVY